MRRLNLIRILEYYDVPQLFVAEDTIGMQYLCLLYNIEPDGELMFIGVAVSATKLNDFIKGHIDLKSMFKNPEMEEAIYSVYMKEDGIMAEHYTNLLDESMLPEDDYFYNDSLNENEEMIIRASTTNKPIIRLAFQTPQNYHDIDARCLSAALIHFQSLVDNSYKKLYKNETHSNSTLRVTTFMAASFDVEFVANENLDVFGQSKLGQTFDVINKLFSNTSEEVVETLRNLKGYAANSYKNFLEVLLDNDMSINLKWVFSTLDNEVHQNNISRQKVQNLHEIIANNSNLGIEEVTFEGHFTAANTSNGKWVFQPKIGKEIKGDSNNLSLLTGITLTEHSYTIVCQAQQLLNEATLKEKTQYTLVQLIK